MTKYTFIDNRLIFTPYSHATGIKSSGVDYDVAVRVIILDKPKAVYIRINEFDKLYHGLEYKRIEYKFEQNLKACEAYLRRHYKKHKLYDSYTINSLPDRVQRDILNS